MEKSLDKCLDEAASTAGVVGVICADQKGLCLNSKGNINSTTSGLISELAQMVSQLEPNTSETPMIILESDHLNVYIKSVGNITTAIYKTPK